MGLPDTRTQRGGANNSFTDTLQQLAAEVRLQSTTTSFVTCPDKVQLSLPSFYADALGASFQP
jgi:hypothetical protein